MLFRTKLWWFTVLWCRLIASRGVSLQYFNDYDLASREDRLCTCVAAPPWQGNLTSAVWPAGMTACARMSRLLPDTATCRVRSVRQGLPPVYVCCGLLPDTATCRGWYGRQGWSPVYVCCSSSLTWPPAECSLATILRLLCFFFFLFVFSSITAPQVERKRWLECRW